LIEGETFAPENLVEHEATRNLIQTSTVWRAVATAAPR
jgi:hypothetical protein